jgi:hypothetical protein
VSIHTQGAEVISHENLSRRAILAGAASVPALALPAVGASASTDPDPIFAAIERWKELDAVEQAAFEARDKAIEACDERYGTLISAMSKEGRQFFEANSRIVESMIRDGIARRENGGQYSRTPITSAMQGFLHELTRYIAGIRD